MHSFLIVISILLAVPYAILIQFYKRNWNAIPEIDSTPDNLSPVFISVVIAARNEETNIPHLLKALTLQSYPPGYFEIIVVDDFSTDSTTDQVMQSGIKNLFLIQPEDNSSSKKKAIAAGVRKAKGELIVTTDADCFPMPDWLKTIAFYYRQTGAFFLAGPVKFIHQTKALQLFQAIDFLTLQGITGAAVQSKFYMMCNGANLAFKKQSFDKVNGYEGINHVATGDDMLLMHKIWMLNESKVFFLKSKKAIVSTLPMPNIKSFIMQRKRWASKTFVYNDYRIIAVLVFVYCYNLFLFFLLIDTFFNLDIGLLLLVNLAFKVMAEVRFFKSVARFYEEKGLTAYFVLFQPLHIFYTVAIGIISQLGKYEWKGRRTY